eukprot:TRINITY_DN44471_c0_g1_i1.p3 TRINITY_DN44471_c0_g1~~TRINITY_DN44471_c0_g1_i1.p3  ORF type:complete len:133 (+),score=0.97 TRINITY_DN44471_c0_g1_i1:55-399(+)
MRSSSGKEAAPMQTLQDSFTARDKRLLAKWDVVGTHQFVCTCSHKLCQHTILVQHIAALSILSKCSESNLFTTRYQQHHQKLVGKRLKNINQLVTRLQQLQKNGKLNQRNLMFV